MYMYVGYYLVFSECAIYHTEKWGNSYIFKSA
jgi:hypothetical protein